MTSSTPSDTFYRYDDSYYGGVRDDDGYHHIREVRIHETVLKVLKRTRCGVWLVPPWWNDSDTIHRLGDRPRFVNLSARKRYAYESRKLALESFLARKFKQSKILKNKLADIDMAFWEAKRMLAKEEGKPGIVMTCRHDTDGDGHSCRPVCPVCRPELYPATISSKEG